MAVLSKRPVARVLVIEDYLDAADSYAILLAHWGCEVRTALTGEAGLREAMEFLPHVVLLDLGLPDLSGYEVARILRRVEQLRDTRIIAVTGYIGKNCHQLSEDAGCDKFFVKPISLGLLRLLIDEVQIQLHEPVALPG